MGILDRIKKALTPVPPPTLDDPQFGRLVFCPPDLWQSAEGHEDDVLFQPTLDKVCITVSGNERGPAPQARDVFSELQRRYGELIPSIASFLHDDSAVGMLSENSVTESNVMDSFAVSSVAIKLSSDVEWEIILTYNPEWRSEVHIDVIVRRWQAVDAVGYD